ncbi:MAG TPA: cupredoxin domain-containing protein [Pseudolabrys sp.]|nr:cupredoxin domain-containing protein [Pseudolabrys sp.]
MRAHSFAFALALTLAAALTTMLSMPGTAAADDITITIKDHKFTPAEIRIPANKRMSIVVVNDDPTPEEFESLPMKIEKIIPGNSKALVRFGPIAPGRYEFIGEFNQATAKGVMIAE